VRGKLLVAACVAIVVGPTWWLLKTGDQGARVATDISVPLGVISLAVTVYFSIRARPSEDVLAAEAGMLRRDLAKRVLAEQQKMLAESGSPHPADVGFAPPDVVTWRSDGDHRTGSLSEIAEFYRGLRMGRLLILGKAGAGKSVLANQLLIELARADPSAEGSAVLRRAVPVRLSLPSFDPGPDHAEVGNDVLSARLDAWMGRRLVGDYGVTSSSARRLVEGGWILPVLDGLDEMDSEPGPATRAAAVVRALNHPAGTGLRAVVIACRAARYEQLMAVDTEPGRETVLQDVAVIRMQPLTVRQVTQYLTARFFDPVRHEEASPRWRPVLASLRRAPDGPLARALSSPLRLFMAVTSYHQAATDPSELLALSDGQIDRHLFGTFIPAVLTQHPLPRVSSADVTRWLATFASYLHEQQRGGGSGSDIDLHLLWKAERTPAPRRFAAMIYCLLITVCSLLSWGVLFLGIIISPNPIVGKIVVSAICLLIPFGVISFALSRSREPVDLRRFDPAELRTRTGRHRLALAIKSSIFDRAPDDTLLSRVAVAESLRHGGIIVFPALAVMNGLTHRAGAVSRPRVLVRQGIACDLAIILTPAAVLAVIFASISGAWISIILIFAFVAMWPLAYMVNSPWLPYFIATRMLARRGLLPRRPAQFLDWGYGAGLMRMSGVSVQFRHRELQYLLLGSEFQQAA